MKARWKCSPKGVFGLVAVLTATTGLFGAQDFRPPFDKRDYAGRVGIQLNPWFPPKKPPMHASGGPNVPYLHHEGTELQVWRQAMDLCARYGVDVLVPEINEPRAWTWQWRVLLQAAALTNAPPVKVGMFFGMYSKDKDAVIVSMKKVLGPFREDLRSNPAVNRAGGHPVMVIYNPLKFKSAEWKEIFDALDAEFGRMVYLFNMNSLAVKVTQQCGDNASQDARFEKLLREMLPYWDGISSYGTGFRVPFGVIRKVMSDFPQKINEGEAFLTYLNHFQTGGSEVELSVRPAALGREMGLLGTANGQVNVTLLADGALRVEKTGARDANGAEANTRFTRACVSSSRIEPGVWTKVAVTYDLRLLRLYVNGTACGEVSVGPMRNHERINHVTLGSKCGVVYEPRDFFKGDIRAVRMYGRNLAPEEFLK